MSQMPPSDDIEHKSGEAVEGCASGAVNIASISPDDNATGDDKKSSNESHTDETSVDALSNDHIMPQEFTFFQKKKRADQGVLTQGFAYASIEQITAFSAQLDSVSAANARTKRHIAELMILMSDVARTVTADGEKPGRKRLRLSKWLFYACLVGFGVGWFLLFPSGHNVIRQLLNLW
jgi:hypothetical protein